MKKSITILVLLFLIFSCNNNEENQIDREKKKKATQETTVEEDNSIAKKQAPLELATLFFPRSYFVRKPPPPPVVKKPEVIKPRVSGTDYKVIADWMVAGKRRIKLQNTRTGREYLINEGVTTGEIILVERGLLYYKFKVNGNIIEVKR